MCTLQVFDTGMNKFGSLINNIKQTPGHDLISKLEYRVFVRM